VGIAGAGRQLDGALVNASEADPMRATRLRLTLAFLTLAIGAASGHAALPRITAAAYHLEFNEQYAGRLITSSGGYPVLQVGIGSAAPSPLTIAFDPAAMSSAFLNWVKQPAGASQSLAVVRVGGDGKVIDRLHLVNVTPVQLKIPAIVGAAPKSFALEAVFSTSEAHISGGGATYSVPPPPKSGGATPWLRVGNAAPHEVAVLDAISLTRSGTQWTVGNHPVTVVVGHDRIAYYFDWYANSVLSTSNPATISRHVSVLLAIATADAAPFLSLSDARLIAFEPFNDPAIGMAVRVTLSAGEVTLDWNAFGK
jgi:hypothetical protein